MWNQQEREDDVRTRGVSGEVILGRLYSVAPFPGILKARRLIFIARVEKGASNFFRRTLVALSALKGSKWRSKSKRSAEKTRHACLSLRHFHISLKQAFK